MARWKDLDVNRALLSPEFEGYRLSLDKLPRYEQSLQQAVYVAQIHKDMYSREHVKMFSAVNQLFTDRWDPTHLYVVCENCTIYSIRVTTEAKLQPPTLVYSDIEFWRQVYARGGETDAWYQPTLTFPSKDVAIYTNGKGELVTLETGNRADDSQWKRLHSITMDKSFVLYDSISSLAGTGSGSKLLFLIGLVAQDEEKKRFLTTIRLNALDYDGNGVLQDRVEILQELKTTNVEYVSFQSDGTYLLASSKSHFGSQAGECEDIIFVWQQDHDSVTLTFQVPDNTSTDNVCVEFGKQTIVISVFTEQLVSGDLGGLIDLEGSTWTLSDKKLEITLMKREELPWSHCIRGFSACRQIFDVQTADAHLGLKELSSDNLQALGSQMDSESLPMINQDLEVCDLPESDEELFLCEMTAESLSPKVVVNLSGHQWLYSQPPSDSASRPFCIRHDVDGLLYSYNKNAGTLSHDATFNALGYILASKQKRRFVSSAPSKSYVVAADTEKHAYLYRQPEELVTDFRNRKSGKRVKTTSKQQIIEFEESSEVIGLYTSDHGVYVLMSDCLLAYAV